MPLALIVDDEPNTLSALDELVRQEGFETRTAVDLESARAAVAREKPQVILCDLVLPDGQGTELLQEVRESPGTEFILITGNATVETAVETLRLGAYDYLTKPLDKARLKALLACVRRTRRLKREISGLRQQLRQLGRFGPLVGMSEPMQKVYNLIERVAPTDASVFLSGESGTGKELAASAIHTLSKRSGGPFVALNCGAVSSTLIESQLFGHERGAFTGAVKSHQGCFEQADGGTLLLDEITEMPADLQVKLLRVLETGQVQRVGDSQLREVDVRLISATNRDPQAAVAEGTLREDLLYRLKVFPITMPPLRARLDDVEMLCLYILADLAVVAGERKDIRQDALDRLTAYDWPGNVRQLKNVLRRAFILAEDEITAEHLADEVLSRDSGAGQPLLMRVGMSVADAERQLVLATLDHLGGDKPKAADLLGMSLKTLYNRLHKYNEAAEG